MGSARKTLRGSADFLTRKSVSSGGAVGSRKDVERFSHSEDRRLN
jgi:hypothetical protein